MIFSSRRHAVVPFLIVVVGSLGACGRKKGEASGVQGDKPVVVEVEASAIPHKATLPEEETTENEVKSNLGIDLRTKLRNSQRRISQLPVPGSAATSHEIGEVRRVLANELLGRLEVLISKPDARGIRTRLQDIADRLSLLQKAEGRFGQKALESQFGLIPSTERRRVETLSRLWRERGNFGSIADQVFRDYGLMTCEHVPEMLRQWASDDPSTQS